MHHFTYFCTLPATVSEDEGAFGKIIRKKSRGGLCSLTMSSNESQLAQKLDFINLINDFASRNG